MAVFNSCRRVSLVLRFFDNFLLKLHYTKTKPYWTSIQTMAPLVAMTSRQRGIHPCAQLSSQWYTAIIMSVSIHNSSAADRLPRTGCSRELHTACGRQLTTVPFTLTNPHTNWTHLYWLNLGIWAEWSEKILISKIKITQLLEVLSAYGFLIWLLGG